MNKPPFPHLRVIAMTDDDEHTNRLRAQLVLDEIRPTAGRNWEVDEFYELAWTDSVDEITRKDGVDFLLAWREKAAKLKLPFIVDEDLIAENFEDEQKEESEATDH